MAEKIRQYKGMGGVSSYLQRMWAGTAVCGLVAANVGLFAVNVVLDRALFADNLVPKWGVIAGL